MFEGTFSKTSETMAIQERYSLLATVEQHHLTKLGKVYFVSIKEAITQLENVVCSFKCTQGAPNETYKFTVSIDRFGNYGNPSLFPKNQEA
jgi:hypothetical protein